MPRGIVYYAEVLRAQISGRRVAAERLQPHGGGEEIYNSLVNAWNSIRMHLMP